MLSCDSLVLYRGGVRAASELGPELIIANLVGSWFFKVLH